LEIKNKTPLGKVVKPSWIKTKSKMDLNPQFTKQMMVRKYHWNQQLLWQASFEFFEHGKIHQERNN
jgi:hypothetical protein